MACEIGHILSFGFNLIFSPLTFSCPSKSFFPLLHYTYLVFGSPSLICPSSIFFLCYFATTVACSIRRPNSVDVFFWFLFFKHHRHLESKQLSQMSNQEQRQSCCLPSIGRFWWLYAYRVSVYAVRRRVFANMSWAIEPYTAPGHEKNSRHSGCVLRQAHLSCLFRKRELYFRSSISDAFTMRDPVG